MSIIYHQKTIFQNRMFVTADSNIVQIRTISNAVNVYDSVYSLCDLVISVHNNRR